MSKKLPPSFYAQPTLVLAQALLGKILVRRLSSPSGELLLKGKIVETEAYLAHPRYADEACHAYRGVTERNKAMFGEAGTAYVYFAYGNHFMLNVVSEPKGEAAAVLIRALEPLSHIEFLKSRRGDVPLVELANGPGKLTQAFQIDRSLNAISLQSDALWIEDAPPVAPKYIGNSTRVGITKGTHLPWRYFIKGNPFVSKGKPSGADGKKSKRQTR
ncbi:MAG: DNA-3-methyladenine glycosylase [Chloroherpetonaceae bacterium]|nr:DNA-3-methyladenine glycosylase [Chloroherpetonaceae bacterium]MDW8438453.1 DNA-3-methyladenine glycosylase [Chloroherpetonaceae bacterium]